MIKELEYYIKRAWDLIVKSYIWFNEYRHYLKLRNIINKIKDQIKELQGGVIAAWNCFD